MPSEQEKLNFANTIMLISEQKEITPFESMIWYCDKSGLELEVAATLLSVKLKEMIEEDMTDKHLLKKTVKLLGL